MSILAGAIRAAVGAAALVAGSASGAAVAQTEDELIGAEEYRTSCASCHGTEARGDGPLAEFLTVRPADLTVLSRDNGGEFPLDRVFETIDGRRAVKGHGERDMPVWGARYQEDVDGMLGPFGSEMAVTARILLLVFYLQSVQTE